ncbi:S66 peptidase family protein, partial [Natronoarchaeum mannanilyticum]|uniref:S66 family peptidase n=1 Tax=Natronoarchaeum mannanilyticum TaxID=926360 RepID=UPI0036219A83
MPSTPTLPPAVERGDEVAILSPSAGLAAEFPRVYELGLDRLRDVFDLEPLEFPTARKSTEYLQDHPEERAEDVMEAFRDPEISAVIATIGGFDQVRILDHLDPAVLREHPTRFFGSSDNANLANYLWREGVAACYGGDLMTTFAMQGSMREYAVEYLERALFEDELGELRPADEFTDQDLEWGDPENLDRHREHEPNPGREWHGPERRVTGVTWGGSFEVVDLQLSVDRFLPDPGRLDGGVLLLETSEELPEPWYVRQALLGMGERGLLERFDAVLVGRIKARSPTVERDAAERL